MSNVKLAIRVRPFTDKELKSEKDRVSVVSVVDENTVTITNIKVSVSGAGDSRERVRRFYADYTFDSACAPTDPNYASQEKVFDNVGRQVLGSISRGQSACVLTYGQSATGKTHTMTGTASQPGLVPRICMALADTTPFDVTVSFLEIYNEKVHDLLAGEVLPVNSLPRRKGNAHKDLRVREHPTKGPYVQNLRRVTVHDAESLLAVVSEGSRRRRTAATRRNISSSRSHALLELVTPYCKLHLADLAGSEKSGWEGCGGRQKEGANINKSLVALSNVISSLVNGGSGRGRFVPYRDSALTWLLKDCFTGGGSIFIIATVSPGVSCYGESVSTLRWTTRARCLPAQRPPAAPHVISKAALQSQYNRLLSELANEYIVYKPETGQLIYDDKHWALQINNAKINGSNKDEATIGNIMNFRYPKTDARNSESTPSSIASGSSDIINNMDNNAEISNEINKEIDELFGPALERTRSGSDIEVGPLKNRKGQFRSQEVLSNDKSLHALHFSDAGLNLVHNDVNKNKDNKVPEVSILYDNQRAEIIASVTERLYSKLKKHESPSKVEPVNEKKPQSDTKVVPLNELKICSNARQRLMELSKKALKNKRRIGIPAHTQTRKFVVRVKDQGIDIQTDLQPYITHKNKASTLQQDASTETYLMTPRLKEQAAGPRYSNLSFNDKSTITDNKQIIHRSLSIMTDILTTHDQGTQTRLMLPIKRKKRSSVYTRYLRKINNTGSRMDENHVSPIININISPVFQSDSESLSSGETEQNKVEVEKDKRSKTTTPDLLTNHNNIVKQMEETQIVETDCEIELSPTINKEETSQNLMQEIIESNVFSEEEDIPLPRVTVDSNRKFGRKDYKDLILGRNDNLYPYNIKLSPTKDRDESKRVIRFQNMDPIDPSKCYNGKTPRRQSLNCNSIIGEKEYVFSSDSEYSDTSEISKNNSFIWNGTNPHKSYHRRGNLRKAYLKTKNENKQNTYFLKLENENNCSCITQPPNERQYCFGNSIDRKFKANKQKYGINNEYSTGSTFDKIEKKIEKACSSLETSVNKYNDYLVDFREDTVPCHDSEVYQRSRTPTEYLHHLIQLRKAAVESDRLS